jgi:hypothetical protein
VHAVERRLEPEVISHLVADYQAGIESTELTERYQIGKGTVVCISLPREQSKAADERAAA